MADPIRRDMLERVALGEYSVGELASWYDVSFAAISKHLMVLEDAGLIRKRKAGRKRLISLNTQTLRAVTGYIAQYPHVEGVY